MQARVKLLRDFALPPDIKVFEIGADYILCMREGADGQETLIMYRYWKT
jgi:hypothetical protein